ESAGRPGRETERPCAKRVIAKSMELIMNHPYADELRVGLNAVRAAAKICQTVQASIAPEALDKKDKSPVTIADFASQAMICHTIGEAFPKDPIVAEEDSFALHMPENSSFLDQIHELITSQFGTVSSEQICQWIDRGSAKNYSPRFWTLD